MVRIELTPSGMNIGGLAYETMKDLCYLHTRLRR
jgi:hypothetical protein